VVDKHIFNEQFFTFIKVAMDSISNLTRTSHNYEFEYWHNFTKMRDLSLKITGKVMMDCLSHFNLNAKMKDIEQYMHTISIASDSHIMFTSL